jgi:hypothetical protein
MTCFLVCGDVPDTNQLQTPEFRLLVMYARLGVFPARIASCSHRNVSLCLPFLSFGRPLIMFVDKRYAVVGLCHDGCRVAHHGMVGFGVRKDHWSMGCQEQNCSVKNRVGRGLSGNFERQRLLTAHAMQRKRAKEMFSFVVPCMLLSSILC